MNIFLNRGFHHGEGRYVVSEMNDFSPSFLQEATHDIDGSIMPVKEAGSGYNSNFVHKCMILHVCIILESKKEGGLQNETVVLFHLDFLLYIPVLY